MRIKFSMVTILFLSLFWQQIAFAAVQIQASVSDNAVALGDRFTLTVIINDTDSDFQLNTKALEKDFKVSSPSRSSNSSYINGKSSYQTKWQVMLQAKRIGELTIPSLKVGDLHSEPITISVSKPSALATKTENDKIFIENSLDKKSAYLNQSLILTSKIYISQNSNDLELLAPELQGATVSVYGEDKSSDTIKNGIRYKIITRQYEINATKAGTFSISSPLLSGTIRKSVPVDQWRNRIVSEPINIRGDSLQVTIKEKPANYQGEWLVSEDVRLFEDSAITDKSYHVGEPITRTITLQVASIDTDKLPTLNFNYPKNLRFYPDQDELKDGTLDNLHYAQRISRHAIIADQVGKLTLPEVKLAWWNSRTDKQEFAILPAQTLTILAAEKTAAVPPNDSIAPSQANSDDSQTAPTVIVDNSSLIIWQIVSALLLVALIALILYHLAYRRAQKSRFNKKENKTPPLDASYIGLQAALSKQQAPLAYQALLQYGQSEIPELKSLAHLAQQLHLDQQDKALLIAEIKVLENACADPSVTWDATKLSALMAKYKHQKESPSNKDIMILNRS